ncbi:carbon storage regulator, CsrA [Acetomicrobium thermoterrenum DSM 13490]|uniref:Carbon storage regulator, CsrA n=1 Tax=Acetomicrobium thermoterrenum DSM 13490 TaxID=1120987 RepID=A0A1H3GS37_9BACT|nr:carbon storage regulator, CsrA [Acetomicrobium thermoterrenum DSM 13490]
MRELKATAKDLHLFVVVSVPEDAPWDATVNLGAPIRLGIRAPKDVLILRKELAEEVALSNKLSAKTKDLGVLGSLMKKSHPNNDS